MGDYKLVANYKHHAIYRQSFNELAQEVFGIDFEKWYQRGGWSDRYICYSMVDSNRVIANVSVNKMDLIWEGQPKTALQIGTVMTHPDYRGQGLGASLMKEVLALHEESYDFVYLFGDAKALGFYRKLGFGELTESQFFLPVKSAGARGPRPRKLDLNITSDYALFESLISSRIPVSQTLGAQNDRHLLLFYGLLGFSDALYSLEDYNALVIYRVRENALHLYDIVSSQVVPLKSILNRILTPEVTVIRFHFTPESHIKGLVCEPMQTDDALFVRPTPTWVTKPFMFPYTSHA